MILWVTVGFVVWISCILFILAIIKGGHRVRGNVYEQKLDFQSMINTENRKKEGKKNGEGKTKNGRVLTERRITERRSMDRRITEGLITDRITTEGVLIIERLKQRRLEQRRYGQRRNLEGFGWQEMPSMN